MLWTVDGIAGSEEVITRERAIANGSVSVGDNIGRKCGIAKSAVAGSIDVGEKRVIAKSVVVDKSGSEDVIIIEHKGAYTIVVVAAGGHSPLALACA